MPLEVTPIFFKLQRYDASKVVAAPSVDQPAAPEPAQQQPETPATPGQ
jgi:hypothetical protein